MVFPLVKLTRWLPGHTCIGRLICYMGQVKQYNRIYTHKVETVGLTGYKTLPHHIQYNKMYNFFLQKNKKKCKKHCSNTFNRLRKQKKQHSLYK